MSFRPVTVYAVACEARGCDRTVQFYDYDADKHYELQLDQPEMSAGLRREIADQGWIVSGRVLCPADAKSATDTAVERMEIELTHEPLFNIQQDTKAGDNTMKALTVRQPWAGAIAHQTKRVENRTWQLPAKQEGARILIHAGAQRDRDAQVHGDHLDVYSAVVAIATITGCHWSDDGQCCGSWGDAMAYHWTLNDVTALPEPVPAKGALGFWTPSEEIANAALRQNPGVAR